MIESLSVSIDSRTFYVRQLPARKGLRVLSTVFRAIGPAISEIKELEVEESLTTLAPILSIVLKNLNDDEIEGMAGQLLYHVEVDGTRWTLENIDTYFGGNLAGYLQLLRFALEINARVFFKAPYAEKSGGAQENS